MKRTLNVIASCFIVAFFLFMAFGSDDNSTNNGYRGVSHEEEYKDSTEEEIEEEHIDSSKFEPEIVVDTEEDMTVATDMPIMETVEEIE